MYCSRVGVEKNNQEIVVNKILPRRGFIVVVLLCAECSCGLDVNDFPTLKCRVLYSLV